MPWPQRDKQSPQPKWIVMFEFAGPHSKLSERPTLASFSILLCLLVAQQQGDALRMINLDAPELAHQGDAIQLSCFFALENGHSNSNTDAGHPKGGRNSRFPPDTLTQSQAEVNKLHSIAPGARQAELLYAIKWYKDGHEFFRYLAQEWPKKQALPMDGLLVDVDKSDNMTVVLKNVTLKTGGVFKCEVSTDAPSFITKSIEHRLLVVSLPGEGPTLVVRDLAKSAISSNAPRFFLGDHVELMCSSKESKPPAQLDWILGESLNLTSANESVGGLSMFSVINQRLIRIPGPAAKLDIIHNDRPPHLSSSISWTHEIVNGTLARPLQHGEANNQPISVADTINQLLEISVSRLSISVNPKLVRLLRSQAGSLTADQRLQSKNNSYQQSQVGDSPMRESVQTNIHQGAKSAGITTDIEARESRQLKENGRLAQSLRSASTTHIPRPLLGDLGREKPQRGHNLSPEGSSSGQKFILKIICLSRVLHLEMKDETKIWIIDKTRDAKSGEISYRRPQADRSETGGGTVCLSSTRNSIVMTLIIILISIIGQPVRVVDAANQRN